MTLTKIGKQKSSKISDVSVYIDIATLDFESWIRQAHGHSSHRSRLPQEKYILSHVIWLPATNPSDLDNVQLWFIRFCGFRASRSTYCRGLGNTVASTEAQELIGHGNSVTAVAFSSDGEIVLGGTRFKKVRLWDAATGELQRSRNANPIAQMVSDCDGKTPSNELTSLPPCSARQASPALETNSYPHHVAIYPDCDTGDALDPAMDCTGPCRHTNTTPPTTSSSSNRTSSPSTISGPKTASHASTATSKTSSAFSSPIVPRAAVSAHALLASAVTIAVARCVAH